MAPSPRGTIAAMNRRLFTSASALSLLLWIATLTLWYMASHQEGPPSRFVVGIVVTITLLSVAAGALLPFLYLAVHLAEADRRHRVSQGRCPACNYNLTANTSGVCPECGTPVHATKEMR